MSGMDIPRTSSAAATATAAARATDKYDHMMAQADQ